MTKQYVRDIGLETILKNIRLNLGKILILFIPLVIIVMGLMIFSNKRQVQKFTTSGSIQINNLYPLTYDSLPSLDTAKDSNTISGSGVASNSETITSLLTTDYILNNVIKKNKLDIDIQFQQVRDIKKIYTNFLKPKERVVYPEIPILEVSDNLYNKQFVIKFINESDFNVYLNYYKLGSGKVGVPFQNSQIYLLISSYQGKGNVSYLVQKLTMDTVVASLVKKLNITPVVIIKKTEQSDTGIVTISLTDVNPEKQSRLINDIIDEVRQKTWERQRQNIKQSIEFIDDQLALAKSNLQEAQESLVKYQAVHGVVDVDGQARNDLNQLTNIDLQLMEKQILEKQYRVLYTPNHPLMVALKREIDIIKQKRSTIEAELGQLPKEQAGFINLKRTLDVNQQLYLLLMNKEQDLKIKYAGLSSPVEVLSYATKDVAPIITPLSPKVILSSLIGILFLQIVVVLYLTIWSPSDPEYIAYATESKLLGIIPFLRDKKGNIAGNHPVFNIIYSYFIQQINQVSPKTYFCNIGSLEDSSGKSFIIKKVTDYLLSQGKKVLVIRFGWSEFDHKVTDVAADPHAYFNVLTSAGRFNSDNHLIDSNHPNQTLLAELILNNQHGIELNYMRQIIDKCSYFDCIFIETPGALDCPIFMNLAQLAEENILVCQPSDNTKMIGLMTQGFANLNIKLSCIIYNHPEKPFLKSVYSYNSIT